MISGPRSTSKASFVEKLSIAFLAPTSWLAALAPQSLRGLHVSIAYPAPISWRPCSQSHVKHVSVSTAMALIESSDRRHHAVEFIRNPVSSYFHSQVFILMRLSSLALPRIAIFARKCDCLRWQPGQRDTPPLSSLAHQWHGTLSPHTFKT